MHPKSEIIIGALTNYKFFAYCDSNIVFFSTRFSLFVPHSSPEGNVGLKKRSGDFFCSKHFFWSPLTMKIAFPKLDLILLGSNGNLNYWLIYHDKFNFDA